MRPVTVTATRTRRRRDGTMPSRVPTLARQLARAAVALCCAALAALVLAGPAAADFGIQPGTASVLLHDGSGGEVTQAGAHPDLTVAFELNDTTLPSGAVLPDGNLKDVEVELPRGLVGDPKATPQCRHRDFQMFACSNLTQVGENVLRIALTPSAAPFAQTVPVYNLVPPKDTAARLGFQVLTVSVIIDMTVRDDGSYNLVSRISNISQGLQLFGTRLTLWGVPADHNGGGRPSGAPRRPFLTAPSACDSGPAVSTLRVRSWQQPERWETHTLSASSAPTGCDRLVFTPTLDLRPDTPRAGVPAGYEVRLAVPQSSDPDGLATPMLKDAVVTLPEGVAISPSQADGLQGCTDRQAGLGTLDAPACPAASKIGTATIDTPVLPVPLTGGIFLGQPKSNDAQTGEMVRILVIAEGQGVTIKLEGKVVPDPVTGRLRVTFRDNPQQPFSLLTLRFQGGPRGALTNPPTCGRHTTSAELTSWSGQRTTSTSSFEITQSATGGPCVPLGFAPSFAAGMANAAAGAFAPFTLTFGRDDTQQDLSALEVTLPPGLIGMVSGPELCDDVAAAAGTCGEASRVGSAHVASGPGSNPFQLPGRVYLTGPYGGGPFGLSIVVPALAGPFDLGTVVVRAAIHVDRRTTALRIVSDPMPTILQGIPLRIRRVTVAIDRERFMLNPTSCSAKRIAGSIRSTAGAVADVASRFQVGGCKALPYRPRLALRVGRRGRTRRGLTVPFQATLTARAGDVNSRGITVKLPRLLNSRLTVITRNACTLEEFERDRCPVRVGSAVAVTPLLREPMRGTAHFVRNPARRLPDLMVALRGQGREAGVRVDLTGKVTIPRDLSLRTAFSTIPDVPISSFRLNLVAGRRGAIGTTRNLCSTQARRARARVGYRAQNGALIRRHQRLRIAGCAGR